MKFERDLGLLLTRLKDGVDKETEEKLNGLRDRLIRLRERRVIKINHSVMELVCAKRLLLRGYDVDVERRLTEKLVCDLYATKGDGTMILEIETGFVPPENALDPLAYWEARIASKIARYSVRSDKFGLGTPPHHILQIPTVFLEPPRERSSKSLRELKSRCDKFYRNPPLDFNELRHGCLHTIYVIDVDDGEVEELDPGNYSENYRLI